jgi:sialate O-acetylesterase
MKRFFLLSAVSLCAAFVQADVKLPGWMSSNMVLQQQTKVHLQATAKKGATVKITPSWDKNTQKVVADKATGAFEFDLQVPSAGGPYTLTFDDGKKLVLENVMAGEVWFCSGQSNMEMPVKGWGMVNNYEQEVADANHPLVRLFQVKKVVAHSPQTEVPLDYTNGWAVCSPETVGEFSAAAYFFAREVSQKLGIAIGVVNSSWGGTPAESWVSLDELLHVIGFQDHARKVFAAGFDEDKITQLFQQERAEWMQEVFAADQGLEKGNIDAAAWAAADLDVTGWKQMAQPVHWNNTPELKDFDGIVWMRRTVEIPASLAGKDLKLELGTIDDEDCTYWNGQRVGMTSGWNANRCYTVPGKLVKAGKNVLTVRMNDTGGDGGFLTDAKDFCITAGSTELSLAGNWSWRASMSAAEKKTPKNMTEPVDPKSSWYPASLYNSMVAPFLSMPIRGFLWYQGCSNVGRAVQYESLFQTLIQDWQARFNKNAEVAPFPKPEPPTQNLRRRYIPNTESKALPFYFVQIANYLQRKDLQPESGWAAIREAQRKALKLDGVGMAVNIDIGMANDIHPKNKQEVGRRLALLALNRTYGRQEPCAAPEYLQMQVADGKAMLSFLPSFFTDKLEENADIKGFTVAGPDHQWYVAKAHTEVYGQFLWRVVVECPEVPHPVAVRYGWADNPECTLRTVSGLPVGPFRTDDWDDIR